MPASRVLDAGAGLAFRLLSPAGPAARLTIFIFHRVLAQPDPLLPSEPDAARFDRIVGFIARHFRVLRLADAARRLADGTLPAAAACITFDDGYRDNLEVATPVLRRHGVTATFFIAAGYIDGGRMWNDTVIEAVRAAPPGGIDWSDLGLDRHDLGDAASRVAAYESMLRRLKYLEPAERLQTSVEIARRVGLPDRSSLMMTPAQLRALRDAGMDIGGHTLTHPILRRIDEAQARSEIGEGRDRLTQWLGEAPTVFAYPNGVPGRDYGERDVALVRAAGFRAAVSTARGAAGAGSDLFQIPRFTPWDAGMGRFALRCAQTLLQRRP
jgi:peptidoglycan/xylan/chitin deacetylase (PgdA/CDA1 family)